MGSSGCFECGHDDADLAATLNNQPTGTKLFGLGSFYHGNRMWCFGHRTVKLLHSFESGIGIEAADHGQHCIFGPVKSIVKSPQFFGRSAFDVRTPADGGVGVGVCDEGSRIDFFNQGADGVILTAFVFVAHHGHFRGEVFFADAQITHTVGL